MYIRRNKKESGGEDYEYWTLVESVRTERGPRQRVVATLGKLPGLDKEERVGWEEIENVLCGRKYKGSDLFQKEPDVPKWAAIDVRGVRVERLRQFGDVYLGLTLWKKLELAKIFEKLQEKGKEEIDWGLIFCVLAIGRLCWPSSELAIAESWYEKTALEDLLGIKAEKINEDRLYRGLDEILPHKDGLSQHLQERYKDLFGTDFEFLFYDITSTYFEGEALKNPQAKYGYSRDKRFDCKQVCIGLVVTREGLPIGYEVFDGNRRDVTTLEDMVELMEKKYGQAKRVWVFDRGITSEDNLDYLRGRGCRYIIGTPKSLLKDFEARLAEKDWAEVEAGVEVKIVKHPDHGEEKFILCRSRGREEKERAMLERQIKLLEAEIEKIKKSLKKKTFEDTSKIERRIGRWQGRYPKADKLFEIKLIKDGKRVVDIEIKRRLERLAWAEKAYGCYLLRTNLTEEDPKTLWKTYMQLNQAETAFRMSKSDLEMRPIFHQKQHRVQAHIFICFLALSMYKCLELWMAGKGLGNSPEKLLREFQEIRSMDVVLPVKDRNPIRLRLVGRPDEHVRILIHKLGIKIPNQPKIMQNVVENLRV